MSASSPIESRNAGLHESKEGLDVDWLLHSKKDFSSHAKESGRSRQDAQSGQLAQQKKLDKSATQAVPNGASATSQQSAYLQIPSESDPRRNPVTNGSLSKVQPPPQAQRTDSSRKEATEEPRHTAKNAGKREGRRASWISSLSNKFSGGSGAKTGKDSNKSPSQSPAHEFTNPFDKKGDEVNSIQEEEAPIPVPSSPRRPSVLVAAGTELKVDHPGFLTSALRRLSSGTAVTLGKGAGSGAICPRRIMNVDQNRDRSKIAELEQNKLKRVAFCVDVEIAGVASHGDETHSNVEPTGNLPRSHAGPDPDATDDKKVAKDAKYKEKGEGAALKNPIDSSREKETFGKTKEDIVAEAKQDSKEQDELTRRSAESVRSKTDEPAPPPMTRKKEKKKRSEAERKERKERKRKHAEANGLIPLELTRDDDESDTTTSNSTPGTSTPRKASDQPTTDPLRIYKRCCQLRETTAQAILKDQITQPSATLAEAPGTVAVIDLTGSKLALQDLVTFGDWLAVVPVRKLILDDCNLGDEAVRVILSGLLSCKTSQQARHNRKLPKPMTGRHGQEQMGFIEKLSLKNNTAISNIGWKHIALFLHMSRSLRAIDLTGIPYPKSRVTDTLSRTTTSTSTHSTTSNASSNPRLVDVGSLFARALAERVGTALDELIISGCALSASNVADLVNAAIHCKIRRLGLAANNLSEEGLKHVVRYVQSGICEGLDLGSNDLHNTGQFLTEALDENNPLFALSVADCNLEPVDLESILPRLTTLSNFKFIDISRNHGLFNGAKSAVALFRKYLPKMQALKRIHLADVDLQPDHIIALAEMFPDCPSLSHVNILENEALVKAMNSKSAEQQEEAAGFLASLMTAVRVSRTIVAIEFEVPSADSSEVVKALASQVLAYSLRNLERSALSDIDDASSVHMPDKDAPEVLLHLVGHMDGYSENHDNDEPAPDEDYIIASTGIVKALGVCLRAQDGSRAASRNISPSASGNATPRLNSGGKIQPVQQKKPRDVGRELCETARKIRMRLRPALVKEDRLGNTDAYRRLAALDGTLERLIQRFEDEYPDARPRNLPTTDAKPTNNVDPNDSPAISRVNSVTDPHTRAAEESYGAVDDFDAYEADLARTSSNASLAARALTHEEGRMHRFGQSFRRELLSQSNLDIAAHDDDYFNQPSEAAFAALRAKIEHVNGEELRRRVEEHGPDEVIKQLGLTAEEMRAYRLQDPEAYELVKESYLAAKVNASLTQDGGNSSNNKGGS